VAVVVPRANGPGAFNIVECLQAHGYQGRVFPVNPHAEEILGVRCFPSVEKIREKIDLAGRLSGPRPGACGDGILPERESRLWSSSLKGLADVGERGKRSRTRSGTWPGGGARIVGPYTMGVVNNFCNFTTSSIPWRNISPGFHGLSERYLHHRILQLYRPVGKAIDLGNTCDVDFADTLEYYHSDRRPG